MSYVIVTVADNGVIHAWGHPATGEAFGDDEHNKAKATVARMKRDMTRDFPGREHDVRFRICKVLSDPDQDGTNDKLLFNIPKNKEN